MHAFSTIRYCVAATLLALAAVTALAPARSFLNPVNATFYAHVDRGQMAVLELVAGAVILYSAHTGKHRLTAHHLAGMTFLALAFSALLPHFQNRPWSPAGVIGWGGYALLLAIASAVETLHDHRARVTGRSPVASHGSA